MYLAAIILLIGLIIGAICAFKAGPLWGILYLLGIGLGSVAIYKSREEIINAATSMENARVTKVT